MNNIEKYFDEFKLLNMIKENDNKFLTIERYKCKLNNGNFIYREKVLKNGLDGSAAIIFPITEDGKVILAIEPRVFTEKKVDIGLPAGYIEKDEIPSDAAIRELKEETGYETNNLVSLGSFYPDQGCSGALNHYFLALSCKKVSNQLLDDSEFIKYILVSFDELEFLYRNGYIKGLNTAYMIEAYKEKIKEM